MLANTVYVVTGASRGIGLGLVQTYLARPSSSVVAVVRNSTSATALKTSTEKIILGSNSVLHIVQVDMSSTGSPEAIRERFLTATNNLGHVNILICAAGNVTPMVPAVAITAEDLRLDFEVNTVGPLMMFQALWPLIEKSSAATNASPKFIVLSSSVGSIGGMELVPGGAYGPSKAAINYITRSLHMQMAQSGLVSVALHPGWVRTAMGDFVAKQWGFAAGPPDTVDESVKGVLQIVDEATRERYSGQFVTQKGEVLPW